MTRVSVELVAKVPGKTLIIVEFSGLSRASLISDAYNSVGGITYSVRDLKRFAGTC